jgi:hypothetical protein
MNQGRRIREIVKQNHNKWVAMNNVNAMSFDDYEKKWENNTSYLIAVIYESMRKIEKLHVMNHQLTLKLRDER